MEPTLILKTTLNRREPIQPPVSTSVERAELDQIDNIVHDLAEGADQPPAKQMSPLPQAGGQTSNINTVSAVRLPEHADCAATQKLLNRTQLLIRVRRQLLHLDVSSDVAKISRAGKLDDMNLDIIESMEGLRVQLVAMKKRHAQNPVPELDAYGKMIAERVKDMVGDEAVLKHWAKDVLLGTGYEKEA
ncbi:hypothetical protein PMZ80_010037 [Knufia obscura]|uniref:Uncharacterized protein n=2 Tax=Knufia TaxID=430999 RepID=A0AAN8EI05_9EURO|nr:hypothetical protein PMZ80_010037 [Knufia obscura]KAK5956124.1 hypothetical protein OHC33_002697 [Knufia fluminis]